ncbi:MAG TPA: hypothetical protein VFC56_11920 [Stellaceae bacterium]|nr:hypothetical protein [Stellaceae bacterium]
MRRYGRGPAALFDEGHASRADTESLTHHPAGPVMVHAPSPDEKPEAELRPSGRARRHHRRAKEPEAVKGWGP